MERYGNNYLCIKIKNTEIVLFTRQLAILLASGMPLEEALQGVMEETEKKTIYNRNDSPQKLIAFQDLFDELFEDVEWEKMQIEFLSDHKYYTAFAKEFRKDKKEENLRILISRLSKKPKQSV